MMFQTSECTMNIYLLPTLLDKRHQKSYYTNASIFFYLTTLIMMMIWKNMLEDKINKKRWENQSKIQFLYYGTSR